ncbi:hypothetical protein D3C71_1748570 [compost metagenome]
MKGHHTTSLRYSQIRLLYIHTLRIAVIREAMLRHYRDNGRIFSVGFKAELRPIVLIRHQHQAARIILMLHVYLDLCCQLKGRVHIQI